MTIDPYTSTWSAADHLYDRPVTHWTGAAFPLNGILFVDGSAWRFMGAGEAQPAPQLNSEVQAMNTRTIRSAVARLKCENAIFDS